METSPETRIGAVDTIFDPKGCQIRFSGVILGQVSALRTFFGTQFFWLFGSTRESSDLYKNYIPFTEVFSIHVLSFP